MKLYFELGELDFKKLIRLTKSCPEFKKIITGSFQIGGDSRLIYYLVPVDLIMEVCKGTVH